MAYTNTAWIVVTGENPSDTAEVTVCRQAGLLISKSVDASYDRLYLWDIAKGVDPGMVTVGEDDDAPVFDYTVIATPGGFEDSGWSMSGTITVENPNDPGQDPVQVDVTDVPAVAGVDSCSVIDGEGVTIASGETVVLDYECVITGQPEYQGENTAVVTWPGGESAATIVGCAGW
ncbi:hypothetical protein GCM10027591_07340 [Zhihengliuella somnathii]